MFTVQNNRELQKFICSCISRNGYRDTSSSWNRKICITNRRIRISTLWIWSMLNILSFAPGSLGSLKVSFPIIWTILERSRIF
jgi:hypothetical protein